MVKVTVIIPVYSVENYLQDCLDSVLAQTLTEIEILCIDDASPDRCPEILDEYSERDNRIKVFHLSENRKQGYCRNLGVKEAKGKYVYFLDSDDMIVPEAMKVLYQTAEKEQLQGILFDTKVIYESEELRSRFYEDNIGTRKGHYTHETTTGMVLADQMLTNNDWSVLVQRQFWLREYLIRQEIQFPEDVIHEDEFFSIASVLCADRIRYLQDQLFIRRFRLNSVVTSKATSKNFYGYFINVVELISFLRKKSLSGRPVDILTKKLFANLDRLYPVFLDEGKEDEWFQTDQLKDFYTFYHYCRETWEWKRELDKDLFYPIADYNRIWIYGAGRIGQSVLRRLDILGMSIGGFLVTDITGNPSIINRKKVVCLKDYIPRDDDVIVVAMARNMHQEVSDNLKKLGLIHFLYYNDTLKGPF